MKNLNFKKANGKNVLKYGKMTKNHLKKIYKLYILYIL
jgi:hypothetical protein